MNLLFLFNTYFFFIDLLYFSLLISSYSSVSFSFYLTIFSFSNLSILFFFPLYLFLLGQLFYCLICILFFFIFNFYISLSNHFSLLFTSFLRHFNSLPENILIFSSLIINFITKIIYFFIFL